MNWQYEPEPAQEKRYHFDGKTHITPRVQEEIDYPKILDLILLVQTDAQKEGGLDKVQKLTETTTGKIVWIIQEISEQEKKRLTKHPDFDSQRIQSLNIQTVLFPEEY